jgi:hypothetical protein
MLQGSQKILLNRSISSEWWEIWWEMGTKKGPASLQTLDFIGGGDRI